MRHDLHSMALLLDSWPLICGRFFASSRPGGNPAPHCLRKLLELLAIISAHFLPTAHSASCFLLFLTDFVYVHVLLILLSCSDLHCHNKLRFKGTRSVGGFEHLPVLPFFLG